MFRHIIFIAFIAALARAAGAQNFYAPSGGFSHDADYQRGLSDLDGRRWREAITAFSRAAAHNASEADAALYWKAYAQSRTGDASDALGTLGSLKSRFPSSRWLPEARALEVEIQAQTGRPIDHAAEHDANLKLIALENVMQSNPAEALPRLRTMLSGNANEAVKRRALFVLAGSGTPEAHNLLADTARSNTDGGLRAQAIQYFGMTGGESAHRELLSIYQSNPDEQSRNAILQQLALHGYSDDLWRIYNSNASVNQKRSILQMMVLNGKADRLLEVAKSQETKPELRVTAIHSLVMMRVPGSTEALIPIFHSERNQEIRRSILQSLALQGDGKTLVALAREEKDPKVQEEIVQSMASLASSKEVKDYMQDLLK